MELKRNKTWLHCGATADHVPVALRAWRFVSWPLLQGGGNGFVRDKGRVNTSNIAGPG